MTKTRTSRRRILIWSLLLGVASMLLTTFAGPFVERESSVRAEQPGYFVWRHRSSFATTYLRVDVAEGKLPAIPGDPEAAANELRELTYDVNPGVLVSYSPDAQFLHFRLTEWGFPLRAFSGWAATDSATDQIVASRSIIVLGGNHVPLRPDVAALIGNTLILSIAWGVVLGGLVSLRAFRRRRLGLCPHCAYSLAGQSGAGCPECGWNRS